MKTLDLKLKLDVTFNENGSVDFGGVHYGESTKVAGFLRNCAFDQEREKYIKFKDSKEASMNIAKELVGIARSMISNSNTEEVDASPSDLHILESIIKKLKDIIPARLEKDLKINVEFVGGWVGGYRRQTWESPAEYPEFEVEKFKVDVDGLRIIEFWDMYEIIEKELKNHEHQLTVPPNLLARSTQAKEMLERELEDEYEITVVTKNDTGHWSISTTKTEITVYVGSNGDDGFEVTVETNLEEKILEEIKKKTESDDY